MAYTGPTIVQAKANFFTSTAVATAIVDAAFTSGNSVLVVVTESGAADRYFTVTGSGMTFVDSYGGSTMQTNQNGRNALFFFAASAAAVAELTVSAFSDAAHTTSASPNFHVCIIETETAQIGAFSGIGNGTSVTSFPVAASGQLDAPAQSLMVGVATFNASGGTITAATGFTLLASSGTTWFFAVEYKQSEAGETDQQAPFGLTTARLGPGQSIALTTATATGRRRVKALRNQGA